MSRYIKQLISGGEHQSQDFKFEISDARRIARSLVAFANTDGGRLLLGVKDNGAIAGVRSEEEYFMLEAAAGMYCKPAISFKVNRFFVDRKTVLEVLVSKSEGVWYYAKDNQDQWKVYIRVNDQNFLANGVLLKVWARKNNPDRGSLVRYSEKEQLLFAYLNEHGFITMSRFCKVAKISRKLAERVLVDLISIDLVDICFTETGTYYCLPG
ncbi:MAG: helix-turn-helix domain-containing protein [Bacteroidota bacterium]